MHSILAYFLVLITAKLIISFPSPSFSPRAWTWFTKKQDADHSATQEPPTVFFGVPFLGSLHGLMSRGVSYYETIRDEAKQSVYTTWVVSQKFYIVTCPELISKINRQQRVISSNGPFIETVYGKLLNLDQPSIELLRGTNENGESLVADSHHIYHAVLKPGHSVMEQMLLDTLSKFPTHFHSRLAQIQHGQPIELMSLLQTSVAMAMGDALYGPNNPFAVEPSLLEEFWNFEDGVFMLVMNIFPSWTAAKAVRGRQKMIDAFRRLYRTTTGSPSSCGTSGLVKEVRELHEKYNCSEDHIARAELGLFLGLTTSLVPALFWLIGKVAVWDEGRLLEAIRDELVPCVQSARVDGKGNVSTLSISALKTNCPLYISTVREVLRFTAAGIAAFEVLEDTILESTHENPRRTYHLKRGAALQIPATAVHTDEIVWGPDAAEFVPQRFMPTEAKSKIHPSAFRAFGGGSTLCPGRHVAQDMMLTMAAMIFMEFDLQFVGPVGLPDPDRTQLTSMMKPKGACPVVLKVREGDLGVGSWGFER